MFTVLSITRWTVCGSVFDVNFAILILLLMMNTRNHTLGENEFTNS